MEEIKNQITVNEDRGIVIAELTDKRNKKTKNDETFYILNISICKTLTGMYFELVGEKGLTLTSNSDPLFVFTGEGKNKYAYTLEIGCIYAFWFTKNHNKETNEDYFHVKDWRKLSSEKRSIERILRLVLNKKEEEGEETEEKEISNRQFMLELKKRMREGRISPKMSIADSGGDVLSSIDIDLKDNESNFSINLLEHKEKEN